VSTIAALRFLLITSSIALMVAPSLDLRHSVFAANPTPTPMQAITVPKATAAPDLSHLITRDPFSGAPGTTVIASVQITPKPLPSMVPAPAAGGNGVPNIGGTPTDGVLYVRATIVSHDPSHPSLALLQNGQSIDVVRVGDTLGDKKVTQIVTSGILLSDHSFITIAATPGAGTPITPAIRPMATAIPTPPVLGTPQPQVTPVVEYVYPAYPQTRPTPVPPENGMPTVNPQPYTFGATPNPSATPTFSRLYPWLAPPVGQPTGPGGTYAPPGGQP
jgi:hypothetical protein